MTARFDVPEVMYQVMLWGDRGQNGKGIRPKTSGQGFRIHSLFATDDRA
ncbi:MAG: hypothetical protein M9928_17115 [Anaerolineae bacterium]|nr:hypothetical protein [Anaerolineae bacterium]